MLLGVISGEVNFSTDVQDAAPPEHAVSFYVELMLTEAAQARFRFVDPIENEIVGMTADLEEDLGSASSYGLAAIPIARQTFKFPIAGEYKLQACEEGHPWETLHTIYVSIDKGAE